MERKEVSRLLSVVRRPPSGTPESLYRSATARSVDVTPNGSTSFTATSPLGAATGQFGVSDAYLADWAPFIETYATDPADSYPDIEFANSQLTFAGSQAGDTSPTAPLADGQVASNYLGALAATALQAAIIRSAGTQRRRDTVQIMHQRGGQRIWPCPGIPAIRSGS